MSDEFRFRTRLTDLVYGAVVESGRTQIAIAAEVGISEKHMCQVINGKSGLSHKLAEAILARCGFQLVMYVVPVEPEDDWIE